MVSYAKVRLKESEHRPIQQDDVIEMLKDLNRIQEKVGGRMDREMAGSKESENTEWDQAEHAVFVVPTFQMAHSPKAIADFTLLAIDHGAKSADLVYKMMVAEMDAAVARYHVAMNAGLYGTMSVAKDALLSLITSETGRTAESV
jgi:hypothetical protein